MNQHLLVEQIEVLIEAEKVRLEGTFTLPEKPKGIVVFAHGSGSSRFSVRNRLVAETLNDVTFGTLLFDLLTPAEQQADESTGHLRFDIRLLASRLNSAVDWLGQFGPGRGLPMGLFGASTGAAAALVTAAERPEVVRALVSRGGRPDLAGEAVRAVKAPTLLIVGAKDTVVIGLNRAASRLLSVPHRLELVPGASHLFQEPGTLEEVARLARDWLQEHLQTPM